MGLMKINEGLTCYCSCKKCAKGNHCGSGLCQGTTGGVCNEGAAEE